MPWKTAQLVEVIQLRKEFITIDDIEHYKRCRVQLHAKGVVLRDIVPGAEIKTKEQQVCQAGEFLVAEIDAKVGGFGIVPEDLEGAIVSSHYFLFTIDENQLDRQFLDYFLRTLAFREQVTAQGSTNYAAIRPTHVLGYTLPLPPLPEQRRVVAKVDELAAKIEEAKGLKGRGSDETVALERSSIEHIYHEQLKERGPTSLADACTSITDGDHLTPIFAEEGVPFIFVGNVSTGKLHFRDCKSVAEDYFRELSSVRKPNRGDVLYSAVGATLGVPVVVDTDGDFCFQRHIAILKPDRSKVSPDYMRYMLRSATVFDKAWRSTTGTAQPTIPLRGIRALEIPLPALHHQHRIVAYLDDLRAKVDSLKELQAQTQAELDALLPSILDKAFKGEL